MQTYIDRVKSGEVILSDDTLDAFVEEWHTSDSWRNHELHSAIGLSGEQYALSLVEGRLSVIEKVLSTKL